MPKTNNVLLKGLRGKLGKVMVFRQVNGETIVSSPPSPPNRRKRSAKVKANQERFAKANSFAKNAMKDPEWAAGYAARITSNKNAAHRVAVADFMHRPVVHYVNTTGYTGGAGEIITIKATDDFKVVSVTVKILDKAGKRIEKGEASRYKLKPNIWKYTTTQHNPHLKGTQVHVTAFDQPQNLGEMKVMME